MFENISALEREVETFQKNMLASNELVQSLRLIAEESKAQTAAFKQASDQMGQRIDGAMKEIEAHGAERAMSAMKELRQIQEENRIQMQEALQQSDARMNQRIDRVLAAIEESKAACEARASDEENKNSARQREQEEKYEAVIAKLDALRQDEALEICKKTHRSMNAKFWILLGGMIIILALTLYSYLVK